MDEKLEIEELSTEDKKKAVNLQDLIYVKKYIDDRHYDKDYVDTKLVTEVVRETTKQVDDAKQVILSQVNTNKQEILDTHYNKTVADSTFYKRTDTVDDATNAVNATNSTYAQYASDDTSKGTIEDRLTNLGFREGSVLLPSGHTASVNKLTRQGNYVIGEVTITSGPYWNGSPQWYSGNFTDAIAKVGNISIGSLPEEFRPKGLIKGGVVHQLRTDPQNQYTGYVKTKLEYEISGLGIVLNIYSNTNNQYLTSGGMMLLVKAEEVNPLTIKFGYEAIPLRS